jgi:4-amino-4-deoxy-L-arabinose transferase-like glycosyltransferase
VSNAVERLPLSMKLFLMALTASVYVAGLAVKVMDIDAAQYAAMSREMLVNHHYCAVLWKGLDYLDKPPLLFWLAALSFKLFGVSTVAYKAPSLLMTLLGFYATFRLGKLFYGKNIGLLAAILLSSCQAYIYFTNDVRTDANLAAAVVLALWQIMEWLQTKKPSYFFGACLGIALAMLAKGPIGLMVPLCAVVSYCLARREPRMLLKWYWYAGLALVLLLLAPMLWGLYRQFGTHGLVFYFWTQSFGRITGQSSWRDSSGYFYFVHTFLWAFLPWMLLACYGMGVQIAQIVKRKAGPGDEKEIVLLGGILLPFIALSCSHYKLPHYIFVVFPFVAIMTAKTVFDLIENPARKKALSVLSIVQTVVSVLLWVFALVCMTVFFPCKNLLVWLLMAPCVILTFHYSRKTFNGAVRLVLPSLISMLGVNLMLTVHFFPHLLSYQGGSHAGLFVRAHHIPVNRFFAFKITSGSVDFYAQSIVPRLDSASLKDTLQKGEAWIYCGPDGKAYIERLGHEPDVVDSFPNMHVAMVTGRALFYKTRPKAVGTQYIVYVGKPR